MHYARTCSTHSLPRSGRNLAPYVTLLNTQPAYAGLQPHVDFTSIAGSNMTEMGPKRGSGFFTCILVVMGYEDLNDVLSMDGAESNDINIR
jgi:hypothetical protein